MPFTEVVYDHFIMSTHIVFISIYATICYEGRKCVSEFADSFIGYCLKSYDGLQWWLLLDKITDHYKRVIVETIDSLEIG